MTNDATIVFVSSNKESPRFEGRVVDDLLKKCGDLPIISVTQKPVKLGTNIVVGQIGCSGYNFLRQIQIACENSETDIVISAESDCVYSTDYFQFRPEKLDIPYRNTNIYVQKYGQDYVCKKNSSTFSQVVGREFYLKRLEELFGDLPFWNAEMKNFPKEVGKKLFDKFKYFETEYPCISFKTGKGMRKHSNTDEKPVYGLPHWGDIKSLRRAFDAI